MTAASTLWSRRPAAATDPGPGTGVRGPSRGGILAAHSYARSGAAVMRQPMTFRWSFHRRTRTRHPDRLPGNVAIPRAGYRWILSAPRKQMTACRRFRRYASYRPGLRAFPTARPAMRSGESSARPSLSSCRPVGFLDLRLPNESAGIASLENPDPTSAYVCLPGCRACPVETASGSPKDSRLWTTLLAGGRSLRNHRR